MKIKNITLGKEMPVVCIPVAIRGRDEIVEKIRELGRRKVPLIEWRVDMFEDHAHFDAITEVLLDVKDSLADTAVIFTYRSKAQGGEGTLPYDDAVRVRETGAKSGVCDLIDFEYFESKKPEREMRRIRETGSRIIASHHDFSKTPMDPIPYKTLECLVGSGADIAKLALMPHDAGDVLRLLKATYEIKKKYPDSVLVTMSMGKTGMVSRVCGGLFGSCVTFGSEGEASAPGQIPAGDLSGMLKAIYE